MVSCYVFTNTFLIVRDKSLVQCELNAAIHTYDYLTFSACLWKLHWRHKTDCKRFSTTKLIWERQQIIFEIIFLNHNLWKKILNLDFINNDLTNNKLLKKL